jgi:hypothetical protein
MNWNGCGRNRLQYKRSRWPVRIRLEMGNCLSWMTAKGFDVGNRMQFQLKFQRDLSLRVHDAAPSQGKTSHLKFRRIRLRGMFKISSLQHVTNRWGRPDNVCCTKTQSQTMSNATSFKGYGTVHAHKEEFTYSADGRFWPQDLCYAGVRRKSASLRLVSMRSDTILPK